MRFLSLIFILLFTIILTSYSQNNADSLIRFIDLRFHSEFEKKAFSNFIKNRKDTFNLFLSIDENMNSQTARDLFAGYIGVINELKQGNIL